MERRHQDGRDQDQLEFDRHTRQLSRSCKGRAWRNRHYRTQTNFQNCAHIFCGVAKFSSPRPGGPFPELCESAAIFLTTAVLRAGVKTVQHGAFDYPIAIRLRRSRREAISMRYVTSASTAHAPWNSTPATTTRPPGIGPMAARSQRSARAVSGAGWMTSLP